MARNSERNVYLTVGIPRASAIYQKLLSDSQESQVSLSKLIVLRAMDWYKMNLHQVALATEAGTNSPQQERDEQKERPIPEDSREHDEQQAQRNAALALDAWL